MIGRLASVPLLAVCVAVTALAGVRLDRLDGNQDEVSSLLYLPNGKYLRVASLGQRSLLADVVYLWAIQHYANYERQDRYRYVEHVFGNVIAELDPHYVDAYWMGALILTLEAKDLEGGLRLLDQGFANNPDQWILPYLAGWECRFAGDFERAAAYFRQASDIPSAPRFVARLVAGMVQKAGSLEDALALWRGLREDPESDPATVAIADRQVRDLQVRVDLQRITQALGRFRNDNGQWPGDLETLAARGDLAGVPLDPDGSPYDYDSRFGSVTSRAGRVLGEH